MKEYHPADSRYRGPNRRAQATPIRSYLAERENRAPAITAPRSEKRAERQAAQSRQDQAYRETQTAAPLWLRLIPFGSQWIDLKSEHARNTSQGRGLRFTALQIIGAVVLYFVLSTLIDPQIIAL